MTDDNEIEPLEDDIKELGDKEAFEDQVAEGNPDIDETEVDEPEIVDDEEVTN